MPKESPHEEPTVLSINQSRKTKESVETSGTQDTTNQNLLEMNSTEGKHNTTGGTDKSGNELKNGGDLERKSGQSFVENQTSHSNPNDPTQQTNPGSQQTTNRTNANFSQQPASLQNVSFHGGYQTEMSFDPMRMPRNVEDFNMRSQTSARMMEKISTEGGKGTQGNFPPSEERYHLLFERETRWSEVRKYSEFIRRFATEASHMEITKENYYDLYNMAVCLLKSVDSLDPDKIHNMPQRKGSDFDLGPQMPTTPQLPVSAPVVTHPTPMPSELELLQARKSFDYYYNRSNSLDGSGNFLQKYPGDVPLFYNNPAVPAFMNSVMPTYPTIPKSDGAKQTKNFSGEVFFDDLQQQQDDGNSRRPKRRRRRTVYSSRRNLHCHMCGVTETPEWRRGPAGDHTLCNACGLHYAKSLKKQRKEREGRKHSIEMLLNNKQSNPNTSNETPQ